MVRESCILAGKAIRLEPLSLEHHEQLTRVALLPIVSRWMPFPLTTSEDVLRYIGEALAARDAGTAIPFATIEPLSGQVIGTTRYGNMDLGNRRVEIGWTFIAPEWQRTRVNTEAKYLMLRYAFEELACMRVELKTDLLNEQSRRAILRLGAKEEGIFRSHMVCAGGRTRDTVYFSIIDREWATVKAALESKLAKNHSKVGD